MPLNDQLNDAIHTSLSKDGYKGSLNDMLVQWLKASGGLGSDLMDLWRTFFNLEAVPQGQHNERYQLWLTAQGFKRPTLADSQLAYWKNRANL